MLYFYKYVKNFVFWLIVENAVKGLHKSLVEKVVTKTCSGKLIFLHNVNNYWKIFLALFYSLLRFNGLLFSWIENIACLPSQLRCKNKRRFVRIKAKVIEMILIIFLKLCLSGASLKSSDYYRPAPVSCKRSVRVLRVVPLWTRVVPLRAALIIFIFLLYIDVWQQVHKRNEQVCNPLSSCLLGD